MDWSPERVLNFGPVTHRRGLRWQKRTNLLWPVHAWQVVTPETKDSQLNLLQRAVLRFQMAGMGDASGIGALLGIDGELVLLVVAELRQMNLLTGSGAVSDGGARLLDESEQAIGETRVGWVFQDTWTGRLFPRFVTSLEHADVEADDEGHAWVRGGSKGSPRRDRAFVLWPGKASPVPPQPIDVIEAASRHRRHARRLRRANLDLDAVPAEALNMVSLIADQPECYHLQTFAYVPENLEQEDEPWYIADPFGFGASTILRDQLERLRAEGQGGLRDILDRLTAVYADSQRASWQAMQDLIHEGARDRVAQRWPQGAHVEEDRVRDRLVLAFEEIVRLEEEETAGRVVDDRLDGAYLKLRQSIEQALHLLRMKRSPHAAWRKLYQGERWVPKDVAEQVVAACTAACGFQVPCSSGFRSPNPGKVKGTCLHSDSSNLRPLCVAFVLAAAEDVSHPLRQLAITSPDWLREVDRIADAAGAEVHKGVARRSLENLQRDADVVVRLCDQLLTVLTEDGRDCAHADVNARGQQ